MIKDVKVRRRDGLRSESEASRRCTVKGKRMPRLSQRDNEIRPMFGYHDVKHGA
jgi:hypothetical protein